MSASLLYPASYAPWLSTRIPGSVEESLIDCDNCTMVEPTGLTRDPGPFAAHLKCCTYFPFVPNFSLGGMLIEEPGMARLRIETAAAAGILLPLGLFASPEIERKITEAGETAFGQIEEHLCPFFDRVTLGCSVWRHRPGVCTTYFCKSERGAAGLAFWEDVETYLNLFEWKLSLEVAARLGLSEDTLSVSEASMLEEEPGPMRDHLVNDAWGEWKTRKLEFLELCAQTALEITPDEIAELLEDDGLALEASLRERAGV